LYFTVLLSLPTQACLLPLTSSKFTSLPVETFPYVLALNTTIPRSSSQPNSVSAASQANKQNTKI
ncbi:hypothetical protein TNCT_547491, partial [Trichonephila clavata]